MYKTAKLIDTDGQTDRYERINMNGLSYKRK